MLRGRFARLEGGHSWAAASNATRLPKGRTGIYGGTADPQPGDEQRGRVELKGVAPKANSRRRKNRAGHLRG